jgi:hypothetical protein
VMAGLYDKKMFSNFGNCQTIFWSGCTILYSHQQWLKVPIASHPCTIQPNSILDFGHSNQLCMVIFHCFTLYFLDCIPCSASFHVHTCLTYIIFGEVRSFAHF